MFLSMTLCSLQKQDFILPDIRSSQFSNFVESMQKLLDLNMFFINNF